MGLIYVDLFWIWRQFLFNLYLGSITTRGHDARLLVSGKTNCQHNLQFVAAEVDNSHRIFYYRYVFFTLAVTMLNPLFNVPNCVPSDQGLKRVEQKYFRLRVQMHILWNQDHLKKHKRSLRMMSKRKMVYFSSYGILACKTNYMLKETYWYLQYFFFSILSGL